MTRPGQRALLGAVTLVVGVVTVFWTLERSVRTVETAVAAWVTGLVPAPGRVFTVGVSIIVLPEPDTFFRAVLMPSCSGLAAAITMAALVPLGRPSPLSRRLAAAGAAAGLIFAGNTLRIASALVYGRYQGRAGMIFFHDIVGGTFTFLYVVVGFIVGLMVLLPRSDAGAQVTAPLS